jgi:hypothetical protein
MNFVYDINGNIYINKDDEYYLINIDKNDNIELEKVINKNINTDTQIELNKINKQNALHIKSIENAIEELEEYDDDDEKDKFNDIYDKYNSYIYNPEQRFYYDDDNFSDEEDYDYTTFIGKERTIKLYASDTNTSISNIINKTYFSFDVPIYESLIIQGDIGMSNLIFRTQIQNDQALYRLTIYTSGVILLNIIGTKITKYIIDPNTFNIKKDFHKNIKA